MKSILKEFLNIKHGNELFDNIERLFIIKPKNDKEKGFYHVWKSCRKNFWHYWIIQKIIDNVDNDLSWLSKESENEVIKHVIKNNSTDLSVLKDNLDDIKMLIKCFKDT
jgi:hypothetical protein